jgi:starch synthase
MRILFVTPECAPFAKTGGLGDVSAALPAALRALGLEVDVLLPGYAEVMGKLGTAGEAGAFDELGCDSRLLRKEHVLVLRCAALYERDGTPYQDASGQDWPDNALRYGLLSRVAARLAREYDVVHCNDWQAALAPVYERRTPSVLTVHNLAFQGNFDRDWLARLGLPEAYFSMEKLEFHGRISFLKGGLVHADAITTVSPGYAREIRSEEYGCGLDGVLRARGERLSGIINGIATEEWDPATDPHLAARYDADSLERKRANKEALQRRLNLAVDPGVPLLGFIGRLTHQKGADLIAAAADELVAAPAQLVFLGRGERGFEVALAAVAARHPGRVAAAIGFNEELAHLIEAGADIFLMPSRFEPCGLNQMYSQRYGTPPVARATGGLADTVADGETGFLFEKAESAALVAAVRRALACYQDRSRWREMQRAAMRRDFSWAVPARRYADLYALARRQAPR